MDKEPLNKKFDFNKFELLSTKKFIVLCFFSIGLYQFWWIYKTWRFFRERDTKYFSPLTRTILSIVFLHHLFERIQVYSRSNGYTKSFSSSKNFLGFILANLASRLPDSLWLISFTSILFLIPALTTMNYGIQNSGNYNNIQRSIYNRKQIGILIIGTFLWSLILIGFFLPTE